MDEVAHARRVATRVLVRDAARHVRCTAEVAGDPIMTRLSYVAAFLALACAAGCRRDDGVSTTTTTSADVPTIGATTVPTATAENAAPGNRAPATSSLEGVGGGTAPGMPPGFPADPPMSTTANASTPASASRASDQTTSDGASSSSLDNAVAPAPYVAAPVTPTAAPLVSPGLDSTTRYGAQGPTGGPLRPGAASNPDTTSGAR
jgi:hypothetical protein